MARNPYYDTEKGGMVNGGPPPRFDYDSEDFYNAIDTLARNGATDKEIAPGLKSIIGVELSPSCFCHMKKGDVKCWTDEENEKRSTRILQTLESARLNTNRLVKSVYLSTALGRNKNVTKTTVRRRLRVGGELTDDEEIQTTEVVSGIAPNLQALSQWLYNHDEDWRRRMTGETADTGNAAPQEEEVKKGIDVTKWLDMELKDKEENNGTHA